MTNDGGEHERSEPSRRREEMSGERAADRTNDVSERPDTLPSVPSRRRPEAARRGPVGRYGTEVSVR